MATSTPQAFGAPDSGAPLHADLRQIIYALSDTLDLVGVDEVAHGKRVAIMAAECGKQAGLKRHEITLLFDAALLRDIGVSSTQVHDRLLREFDWPGAQEHCEQGADLLQEVRPLAPLAEPIRLHHTRWDQLEHLNLPRRTQEQANLIFLADRVNMLASAYYADRPALLRQAVRIREEITARANTYFSPRLVVDFLAVSGSESFWLNLELQSVHLYLGQMLRENPPIDTPIRELRRLARLFSRIVDGKSPYMARHSQGVAKVARYLAARKALAPATQDKIEIAGLLHDLGKLRIPDEIMEKPGPLDEFERHIMKTHSLKPSRSCAGSPASTKSAIGWLTISTRPVSRGNFSGGVMTACPWRPGSCAWPMYSWPCSRIAPSARP